jgi:CBS domain containing-hemolysin-like protein
MTTTAHLQSPMTATSSIRRTSAIVGVLTYAVGAAFSVLNTNGVREAVIVLVVAAVVGAVVFGWLVPRGMTTGAPGAAVGLSAVAVLLLLPAFWSMLPLLLGVAGAMLGRACVEHAPKRSYAAIALGAISVVGYLVLYVVVGLIMGDL